MPWSRPLTQAELETFRDSSGVIRIENIFLSQGLEPIVFPSQDALPPETPPLPLPRPLTQAELETFRDSSGVIRIENVFLSQGLEPIVFPSQDALPPEEPETLPPLTQAELELDAFRDSSGGMSINDIFLSQGLEPIIFPSQDVLSLEEREPLPLPRPLTQAELDIFRDSSGRININDIFLSQGLEPIIFQPQDEPPPEEPETPIHYLTQAELDALADSSGSIDNNAIFMSQGREPVIFQTEAEFAANTDRTDYDAHLLSYQSKGLTEETISKYLKTMNADEIRAYDKDGDRKICAVCLDDVCGHKDIVAILDYCGHEFHFCCLKKWLLRKNICPLCRRTAIFRRI